LPRAEEWGPRGHPSPLFGYFFRLSKKENPRHVV
jgi:hypothetical protein